MQPAGALAALLAQHGDAIAPPLGRIVPQRIVAPHLARVRRAEPDPDMRAGGEARQVMPVRIDQLVAVDVLGQIDDRADAQLHGPLSAEYGGMQSAFSFTEGRFSPGFSIPQKLSRIPKISLPPHWEIHPQNNQTK